jgi:arabinofuranosyltransferase
MPTLLKENANKIGIRSSDLALLTMIIAAVILLFALANAEVDVDDAYIAYRYAQNLAAGRGFVYNEGERVFGITNVLWAFVIGVISAVTRAPTEAVSNFLCLGFLILTIILSYLNLRKHGISIATSLLFVALCLSSPLYLLICTLGMETSMYAFLILAGAAAAAAEKRFLAGLLAGLAFATRPDGLAVLVAVLGLQIFEWLREPEAKRKVLASAMVRVLAGFGFVALPYLLFCLIYYGQLLPETLAAKRAQPLLSGRWWMPRHFLSGPGLPVLLFGLVGVIAAFRSYHRAAFRASLSFKLFALCFIWLATYATAWTVVGLDFYHWYVAAMGPASALLIVASIRTVAESDLRHSVHRTLQLVGILVACYWCISSVQSVRAFRAYLAQVEVPRKHIGQRIGQLTIPKRELVGMGAIGIVGYFCDGCRVLDYSGLVTPRQERPKMPVPTLVVDFAQSLPPTATPLYMHSGAFPAGPDLLVWTPNLSRTPTTWTAARARCAETFNVGFGRKLYLLGVTPKSERVRPGGVIQFEVLWQFSQPLPPDRLIAYYVGNTHSPTLSFVDTKGLYRGRRSYQQVEPGETVLDFVNIPVPEKAEQGQYEVAVMVYPTEGFECPWEAQSKLHRGMLPIFRVEVVR